MSVPWSGQCSTRVLSADFFEEGGQPKLGAASSLTTGVSEDRLRHIGQVFSTTPEDFIVHPGRGEEERAHAL